MPAKWVLRGEGMGLYRFNEDFQHILFRTTDDVGLFSMSGFDFDEPELSYRASAQRNIGGIR